MSQIFQSAVYPSFSLCSQIDLYFRYNDNVNFNMEKSTFSLRRKGVIDTATYFNSVSVGKWKRHTNVDNLDFNIRFKGKIKVIWRLRRLDFSDRVLGENYLESNDFTTQTISLSFWKNLEDGMLSFDIESLGYSEITDFHYSTSSSIINNVKLGIVITHFNRQNYVLPAVDRLKSSLLEDHNFKDKIVLHIVDNSQNLPEIDGITIIPNENLGGAGGFSRGLMALKENGNFTHCLFMDDDASCEVESVKRTLVFLEHSLDNNVAIAGAMLREAEMFRQFENGARFEGVCLPNKGGFDLRDVPSLLNNELEERIDYGGWWFFAFPIAKVDHYAFPYFVRGDDSGFSLRYKFKILTLNGISSWQEDFALKNGPLPHYLDTRYHLMHQFHGLVSGSKIDMIKTTLRMSLKNLLGYQYETALAAICAIEDVAKGKEFWEQNANMAEKRPEIQSLINNEKVVDISLDIANQAHQGNPNEKILARLFRLMTLNGHLLPDFLINKGMVWQHKGFGGNLREIYRHKRVLYIHWPTRKGYILNQDKGKFFSYFSRYIKATYVLYKNYDKLQKEYQESYDYLTSKSFWDIQFNKTNKDK